MLFMKGNPDAPQCGFSRTAVSLLRDEGIDFGSFDILGDNEVRQELKKFSNWPTYPQVLTALLIVCCTVKTWSSSPVKWSLFSK